VKPVFDRLLSIYFEKKRAKISVIFGFCLTDARDILDILIKVQSFKIVFQFPKNNGRLLSFPKRPG